MKTKRGEARRFFDSAASYDGDECLIWPFATAGRGYGCIGVGGTTRYVHRLICEKAHGPPPSPRHDAAHSCGNGHLGCVTKRHLAWKTRSENMNDTIAHGTHNRGARHGLSRLTEDKVREIRSLVGSVTQVAIAARFGICPQHVNDIVHRKRWAWLDDGAPS